MIDEINFMPKSYDCSNTPASTTRKKNNDQILSGIKNIEKISDRIAPIDYRLIPTESLKNEWKDIQKKGMDTEEIDSTIEMRGFEEIDFEDKIEFYEQMNMSGEKKFDDETNNVEDEDSKE